MSQTPRDIFLNKVPTISELNGRASEVGKPKCLAEA